VHDELGLVVSVHGKPWRATAVASVITFAAVLAIVAALGGGIGIMMGVYAILPIGLMMVAVGARRTRVVVHEHGFAWHHDGACRRVRWKDIRASEPRPSRTPMYLAVDVGTAPQLMLPAALDRFDTLRDAIEHRRPTPPTLPVARLVTRS
jgi:hypothetical protein